MGLASRPIQGALGRCERDAVNAQDAKIERKGRLYQYFSENTLQTGFRRLVGPGPKSLFLSSLL